MTVFHRRPGIASGAALAAIALALGVAHAAAPEWMRETGLDVWNRADVQVEEAAEQLRHEQITQTHNELNRQIAASEATAAALIEGYVSLADAAEELARINRDRVGFEYTLASLYPGAPTFRARVARYVIDRVHKRLAHDPTREATVLARLECEYAAMTATR